MKSCTSAFAVCIFLLPVSKEIERFKYFFFRSSLVDADVSDIGEKGEVDLSGCVFFVVGHICIQLFVVFTSDSAWSEIVVYELCGLSHFVCREVAFCMRKVKFANRAPRHCISV